MSEIDSAEFSNVREKDTVTAFEKRALNSAFYLHNHCKIASNSFYKQMAHVLTIKIRHYTFTK